MDPNFSAWQKTAITDLSRLRTTRPLLKPQHYYMHSYELPVSVSPGI